MRVAELQMYRETAFERDGRDSNENAPRVYSQRPPSQAEADVADLYTIIIMSFPRRSRTAQPISYAISSDDEDDKKRVVDLSDQEFENDESNSDDHSSDDEQAQSIAPSSSSPNFVIASIKCFLCRRSSRSSSTSWSGTRASRSMTS